MSRQKPDEQLTTEDLPADPILRAYALLAREVAAAVDRFRARLAEPDGRGWPTPPAGIGGGSRQDTTDTDCEDQ
jgi:hypothetical protein